MLSPCHLSRINGTENTEASLSLTSTRQTNSNANEANSIHRSRIKRTLDNEMKIVHNQDVNNDSGKANTNEPVSAFKSYKQKSPILVNKETRTYASVSGNGKPEQTMNAQRATTRSKIFRSQKYSNNNTNAQNNHQGTSKYDNSQMYLQKQKVKVIQGKKTNTTIKGYTKEEYKKDKTQTCSIFVRRVRNEVTDEQLFEYIENKIGMDVIKMYKMNTFRTYYRSFKIFIPLEQAERAFMSDKWPENVLVQEFRYNKPWEMPTEIVANQGGPK